jgi:hypothetical protein
MSAPFDRNTYAERYAKRHLKTDPGIRKIYYLPEGAPEREIRLLEVNELMSSNAEDLEPLDFGVDVGNPNGHTLLVLDVTPSEWDSIGENPSRLPPGWMLDNAVTFPR